jgi:P-type Ca2+ transporter type 2C
MPVEHEQRREEVPLAVTASIVGIGALGIKQLVRGKSALATSSGLFYTAGILSVITGYPVLKRGSETLFKEGRLSADLVLGTAALGLALVRENLLALAAVGMIQYLQWKRKQYQEENLDPSLYLSTKTKAYAKRATALGLGLAGAAFAITRNPLLSFGVLLSANPRPCLAAEEYAWKNAELELRKKGYSLPANSTLCSLAEVDHVVIEDTAFVYTKEEGVQ